MRSIRDYLRPFGRIRTLRSGMLTSTFARAIAPYERFDPRAFQDVLRVLKQSEESLVCVYCGEAASDWDHLRPVVKGSQPTGYGHTLSNLVPCCSGCNREKGNQDWLAFLVSRGGVSEERKRTLEEYEKAFPCSPVSLSSAWGELLEIREEILALFEKADALIEKVRNERNDS